MQTGITNYIVGKLWLVTHFRHKLIVLTNFCCCMEVFYLAKFCIFMWNVMILIQYKSSSIFYVLVVHWFWLWKAFFSIYGEGIGEIIILCWLSMNVFCMNLGPILFMWLVVLGRHLLFLFWLCRTVLGVKMKRVQRIHWRK